MVVNVKECMIINMKEPEHLIEAKDLLIGQVGVVVSSRDQDDPEAYTGERLIRVAGHLVSLDNPYHVWIHGDCPWKVRLLPAGTEITIRTD